jgi:hypothetical protein
MIRAWLLVGLALMTLGCGGGADKFTKNRPKTVIGSGSVKYKGQPLAQALVVFAPTTTGETALSASAMTDSSGNFSLETWPPAKGVVAGSYKVSIMKNGEASAAPAAANPESAHEMIGMETPAKSLIPVRYGDPEKSGLKADIPAEGRNDLHFELAD